MWENPNIMGQGAQNGYGTPRTFSFAMDVPAVYAAGVALTPTDALSLSGDVRYIAYSSTAGFDKEGFDQTGAVQGFGWDDILVFASGIQYQAHEAVRIRGGYNYSQNPIAEDVAAFNIPAPAVVQHHLTLGLGVAPAAWMTIDAAYYRAFENSVTGDLVTPLATVGTTSSLSEDSFLVQFTFNPNSRR
jgi:long-chain fatty acid transport protein